MANNSTNINKTNNQLSPKESLNCDGQQLHQYQAFFRWEVIVRFVDIGGIVGHRSLSFL
jgi:hypothetical protein